MKWAYFASTLRVQWENSPSAMPALAKGLPESCLGGVPRAADWVAMGCLGSPIGLPKLSRQPPSNPGALPPGCLAPLGCAPMRRPSEEKETILTESFDIEAPKEEARKIQQSTRKLKPGEIVDLRAPGRKQEDVAASVWGSVRAGASWVPGTSEAHRRPPASRRFGVALALLRRLSCAA